MSETTAKVIVGLVLAWAFGGLCIAWLMSRRVSDAYRRGLLDARHQWPPQDLSAEARKWKAILDRMTARHKAMTAQIEARNKTPSTADE